MMSENEADSGPAEKARRECCHKLGQDTTKSLSLIVSCPELRSHSAESAQAVLYVPRTIKCELQMY